MIGEPEWMSTVLTVINCSLKKSIINCIIDMLFLLNVMIFL